ncbi:MAG: hypothetical protein J7639_15515 [Paenibacillaceae bacterium]|nr:hypothetical protein [Paenibacillaceae bacterium]
MANAWRTWFKVLYAAVCIVLVLYVFQVVNRGGEDGSSLHPAAVHHPNPMQVNEKQLARLTSANP